MSCTGTINAEDVISIMKDSCEALGRFRWEDGGPFECRNSDGSLSIDYSGRLTQGLVHIGEEGSKPIACYEFTGRITVHLDGSDALMIFCWGVADRYGLEVGFS